MEKIVIALAGQPNVGKSSLINAISDAKLKVGNFSGVTVDKTEIAFIMRDDVSGKAYEVHIIDLPGAYSLTDYTMEEKVTKRFLQSDEYDIIVNVVDSTNLKRNLIFTTQLIETGKKVVIALNMSDEAKKEGIYIDEAQLSSILGVPCVKTSALNKKGLNTLKEAIIQTYEKKQTSSKVVYSDPIEEEIENIINFLNERHYKSTLSYRHLAVKLLQEDEETYKKMHDEPIWIELLPVIREGLQHIYLHTETKDIHEIFSDEHFAFAKGATMEVMTQQNTVIKNPTQKIDTVLLNRFLGIPIFLFFMWGLFQLTFKLGSIPMDYIDAIFRWFSAQAILILGDGELGSLVADGIIPGVGAVVMFLPNIVILFFGIALLETTGYMSRVAFLLDGFFHKFGLHGKSFIPLVTGFGCSVPAYMAARTLRSVKDRLITLFIIGFMSCGARLPIYVLFTGAFFSQAKAGNILFLIYIVGAFLGLIMAKILKTFVFKGEDEPFVMEMPKYRMPSWKLIWHTVYGQAKSYLNKAGTFILAASIFIWFASNYPKVEIPSTFNANQSKTYKLEQSYLGQIGHASEPFFAPLGMDWRMAVALEAGLAAKEVVISTLGVLYSLGEEVDENSKGLISKIKANIPFASAVSFIVFVMIYLPCLAASMVFAQEAGGWKYLVYLFIMTTASAWILSFLAYRITLLI
ncbi:MAG: ferrous iron transport protein B [Sulfurovum sp.]|nr:MAG: ferrous iron transport protein B [Sulfurovum sp.]